MKILIRTRKYDNLKVESQILRVTKITNLANPYSQKMDFYVNPKESTFKVPHIEFTS